MNKYSKIRAAVEAYGAVMICAIASPVYSTTFIAPGGDTMNVFTDDAQGFPKISNDSGEKDKTASNFRCSLLGEAESLPNVVEIAVNERRLSKFAAAVLQEGLDETLGKKGSFTVFAPTDDAFAALGLTDEKLLALPDLKQLLLYHVVDGKLNSEDVASLEHVTNLLGKDLKIDFTWEGVFINDSKVIVFNVQADNGIIHVIDAVLVPAEMAAKGNITSSFRSNRTGIKPRRKNISGFFVRFFHPRRTHNVRIDKVERKVRS